MMDTMAQAEWDDRNQHIYMALEAEQTLLGALMVYQNSYWRVCDRLSAEHFFDPLHGLIYNEIGARLAAGKGVSAVVVGNTLGSKIPEEIGGSGYLARLAGSATTPFNVPDYAEIIREMYIRRSLTDAASEAIEACRDVSVESKAADIVSRLEARIHETVADDQTRRTGATISDIALRVATHAMEAAERGRPRGISSGLRAFDEANGLMMPGDLIVIGGATSAGKTALAQQILWNAARNFMCDADGKRIEGARCLAFSMEMTGEQYTARHLSQISGLPSERIEGDVLTEAELADLRGAAESIGDMPLRIEDARGLTAERMRSICRRHQHTKGLDLVLIDHLGFIAKPERRMPQLEALEANVGATKALALELGCPVILISHLNRGLWARDDKRPQLADLHGSSAIEKDADVVCFIHREEYWLRREQPDVSDKTAYVEWGDALQAVKGKAEIINGKRRRGRAAQVTACAFDEQATRFYDFGRGA